MTKRKSCLRGRLGTIFGAMVLTAAVLAGQEQIRIKSPEHEVRVTLKLIQVYVTNADGKPVKNLTKEDFVLMEDGRAKKITDFESHGPIEPGPAKSDRTADSVTPPVPALNRKFIFLFNLRNMAAAGFIQAKQAALTFIDTQVGPGDEVGIFSYSDVGGIRVPPWP
jgi:VWFA-related protein